jgi:hypothetical protein
MKAKAAFYFLIMCRQLLSLERYRRKKVSKLRSIAELRAFYGTGMHRFGIPKFYLSFLQCIVADVGKYHCLSHIAL